MDGCLPVLALVGFIAVLAVWLRFSGKVAALETWMREADAWQQSVFARLKSLEVEVARLREAGARPAASGAPTAATAMTAASAPAAPAVSPASSAAASAAAAPASPTSPATGLPVRPPVATAVPPAVLLPRAAAPPPVPPIPATPPVMATVLAEGDTADLPRTPAPVVPTFGVAPAAAAASSQGSAPPPQPPRAAPAASGGGAAAAAKPPFDWEALVGVRLFSWIAGVALVLAALFFLRYSVEQGWLGPAVRMAMGIATGIALLVVCELKAARRYAVTANAMDAAGIAILFASFYAGHALWHLVGAGLTFALLALVAAVAVLLAIRRNSIFIALLGLVGGFATPALLATGEDRPFGLFGYLLLLNVGLTWVAYRRRWAALQALALGLTAVYQIGWAQRFLTAAKLPLALGIFALFSLVAFVAMLLADRGRRKPGEERLATDDAEPTLAEGATYLSAGVPLIFAAFLAAVPAYGAHAGLLFGFLALLVAGLFAIATYRGPEILHLMGGLAAMVVVGLWLGLSYGSVFWPLALLPLAGFAAFFLASPFAARALGRPFAGLGRFGALVGALLLFAFPLLLGREPATADPALVFGVLLGLLGLAAVAAIALEDGPVYLVAAFFGIASEAVWSALRLTPERRLEAFALYGGFAAFYLGVPFLARRRGRRLAPEGGGALLLFASLLLLFFLASGRTAEGNLAGLTLLLALLNLGLFLEGRGGRMPLVAVAGAVLSWLVLAKWWSAVPLADHALGALAAVGGFGVLTVAGSAFLLARRATTAGVAAARGIPDQAIWVGLVGHVFLLYAAGRPELSLPPWPLLGVLLALDVAQALAALKARRGPLLLAALAASQAVLGVWLAAATGSPWPLVALASAIGVAALGLGALALTQHLALDDDAAERFAVAAAVGLFGAQAVAILAALQPGAPAFVWLLAGTLVLLIAELRLGARRDWEGLALLAVVPAVGAAASLGRSLGAVASDAPPTAWWQSLLFAAAVWVPFLVAGLRVDLRSRRANPTLFAAVLAGAGLFFVARGAMLRGGLAGVIGILPVAQALLLAPVLVRLARETKFAELRHRKRGDESVRLALVAGAMLAFVTVAIPMQLEKQWITLGWALLGAALAWLHRRVPHPGLVVWTFALEAAAFVRLALNPAVLAYHPRQGPPVLNWFLYAYLVAALAMFAAAWWLREERIDWAPLQLAPSLATGGTVLLFLLLNIEIADFFSTGETLTFGFLGGSAGLPEDLAYTIGWALFAIALLVAGLVGRQKAVRVCSIALLALTVCKAFLHDTWRLGGLYRVGSLVGLAVSLALVALVLQKFVFRAGLEESEK